MEMYAKLQESRQPLLSALVDIRAGTESLCSILDGAIAKMRQTEHISGTTSSKALEDSRIQYATRALARARELSLELVMSYLTQLAMTQAAIVAVLPQSCEKAWKTFCDSRTQEAVLAGQSSNADFRSGNDDREPQCVTEDDSRIYLHSFGLDAAGETNHDHLTALAAAVSIQPFLDPGRKEELLTALDFIAGCEYGAA